MTQKELLAQIEALQKQLAASQSAVKLPEPELAEGEVYGDFTLEQLTVLRTSYLKSGVRKVRLIFQPNQSEAELRFQNFDAEGDEVKSGSIASDVPFPKRSTRR